MSKLIEAGKLQRFQRQRKRGWRTPPNTKIVDRTSRWGNPFRPFSTVEIRREWFEWPFGWVEPGQTMLIQCGSIEHCVALFRVYALRRSMAEPGWLRPLRGRNVACACPEDKQHCHGDVLLDLANREEPDA